ncbi:hypothetical protein ACEWY4_025802 [Coilia grayii]|uniref:Protein Wnt n=1 Tax=Coilia grayii TaxID=363190 RepID=A0ABD1ITH6_9TELE
MEGSACYMCQNTMFLLCVCLSLSLSLYFPLSLHMLHLGIRSLFLSLFDFNLPPAFLLSFHSPCFSSLFFPLPVYSHSFFLSMLSLPLPPFLSLFFSITLSSLSSLFLVLYIFFVFCFLSIFSNSFSLSYLSLYFHPLPLYPRFFFLSILCLSLSLNSICHLYPSFYLLSPSLSLQSLYLFILFLSPALSPASSLSPLSLFVSTISPSLTLSLSLHPLSLYPDRLPLSVGSCRSLALGQQYSSLGSQPILCSSIPGLVPKQLRFCRNYIEIMPSVAEGVKLGIQECQHQFRGRRWNCTTIKNNLAIFGPVLDKATRESAFVHAIASAGVAYAVTRSCAEGTSTMCGCDSHHKGPPGEGWKWGGCSEDAEFGVLVSREFADARENRPDARSAMNRHNNEAGRMTILENMHLRCKCHGLSGSCEVKTCWWAQPDFRLLGDYLKDKYDSASEMVVEKHRESRGWVETLRAKYAFFKHPTERDLVYYEGSPNFCEPNPETGSFGTRDRVCNVSSHGIEGCDLLCCGRGHNTRTEKRKEKCHCVFHWCCYVSCQECTRIYDVHTCK